MEHNRKLSLKEEMENEARKIEEEIAKNPDLEGIEVSDEMEASLLAKIQAYEKVKAHEKNNTMKGQTEEFSEELVPNFSVHTNDGKIINLSAEDLEALRLGRELLKKKNEESGTELFEVNTEYHKHLNEDSEKKRRVHMPKKKRLVVALVAVFVLVFAMGMTSVGSKSYLKELIDGMLGNQNTQKINVKDMDIQETNDGDELTAYREIRESLGFVPVRLGYKPENMEFVNYKIDVEQKRAFVFYKYKNEIIRFAIYENNSDSSLVQKEEDTLKDIFEIHTDEQDIEIEEYRIKGYQTPRYIAEFTYKDIHYQLKGIIKKEEMVKIVKNFIFFNKKS